MLEFGRVDYGSALRDAAALVSLASEGNAPRATLTQAVQRVEAARGLTPYTSTQENAWLVLASRALPKETLTLDVNGSPVKTALYRSYKAASMAGQPIKITNTGDDAGAGGGLGLGCAGHAGARGVERLQDRAQLLHARRQAGRSVEGQAERPLCRGAEDHRGQTGIRAHHGVRLSPRPASRSTIRIWSLPGDTGTLDWIEDGEEPENTEFRDDRFTAAIDRASDDKAVFTVAYVVRAVSPGKYVLPQAYVEDMYNPSRYGRTGTGTVEVSSGEMSGACTNHFGCHGFAAAWRRP